MKNNYQHILVFVILLQLSLQILCQTPPPEPNTVQPQIIEPTIKPATPQKQAQPQAQNPTQNSNPNPTASSTQTPPNPNPTATSTQTPPNNNPSAEPNKQKNPQYRPNQGSQQPRNTNQPRKYQYVRDKPNEDKNKNQYTEDQGKKQSTRQQINFRQNQKVSALLRQQHYDTSKNYDFELIDTADFYVKSSIQHKYVTVARSYSFIDGNYKIPDRLEDMNPIRIQVFDDKGRKVTSEEFSFVGGVSFDMVPGVSYQIAFYNVKNQRGRITTKLMTVTWKNFAQHEKLSDKMVSDNSQAFSKAALRMRQQAETIFGNFHQLWLFDNQALHGLNTNTMKLFYWSIFEIVATILAAALQIQIIRRLLRPASIVI